MDALIKKYYRKNFPKQIFVPGQTLIPASGKIFNEEELILSTQAVLDGWWTEGRFAQEFERKFAKLLGVRYVTLVNSGSSANLVAFSALTSSSLKEKTINPGSEVITVAAAFPTTVNPIILKNCVPVFVDIDLKTKNAIPSLIKKALSKKTKAIVLAHTLGNPFQIEEITKIAKKNNLLLFEDCCDALGSTYKNQLMGTFGDIATFSFYPAHQITMGEGGAIVTNNPYIHRAVRQFRDWGRDCWCDTGSDNTCGKRFLWKMGKLPFGYDHKFIYSQIGYNVKLTDMQAAIGLAQLEKLPSFIEIRKKNFKTLYRNLKKYERFFVLPSWSEGADPCWFGFLIVVKKTAPFSKLELVNFLESKKIGTRGLFAGNLLKHPAYSNIKYKTIGSLKNTNLVMDGGFWVGVYPGIDSVRLTYIIRTFKSFLKKYA